MISTRTRFEVFKRDQFTCRYCGRRSPEIVLEVDHIYPVCEGGTDDPINLASSCWECNRGKAGVSLSDVMTGEDPHDRAILILEQERQLAEYNEVMSRQRERQAADLQVLVDRWCEIKYKDYVNDADYRFLKYCVRVCPVQQVLEFMDIAQSRGVRRLQYVSGCLKNWLNSQNENQEAEDA
jgi:ferredoxin